MARTTMPRAAEDEEPFVAVQADDLVVRISHGVQPEVDGVADEAAG